MSTATQAWLSALGDIVVNGFPVSPRGMGTLEIPQRTVTVNMQYPVVEHAERRLQFRFMAAEAYWILTGDSRVDTIAPYNKHISQFSDGGVTFAGAYGPMISSQFNYVVAALQRDPDTRQATLTTWRPNPKPSKDIPCTIAIDFKIRNGKLNVHVFMRSSDVWLGLPYDIFNFCMLGAMVCGAYNRSRKLGGGEEALGIGTLYLTAASSHLYDRNAAEASVCLNTPIQTGSYAVPYDLYSGLGDPVGRLLDTLKELRNSNPGSPLRWWESDE